MVTTSHLFGALPSFLNPAPSFLSQTCLQPKKAHFCCPSKFIPTSKCLSMLVLCLAFSKLTLFCHSKLTCFFLGGFL